MDDRFINPARTADSTEEQASVSSAAETPLSDESGESGYRTMFRYTPLESSSNGIRLVVLGPDGGDHDSEITCRITHTTFGAKPAYEALSYTWGDETIKRNLNLDGYFFAVSNNLYEALIRLRYPETERTLWIDAISINQTDTDEKNSQIRIMPFIYKRAESVVVWLGSGIDFNPGESEYWQRVWVIQEFGMARRLKVCWAKMTKMAEPWGSGNELIWTTYSLSWDDDVLPATAQPTDTICLPLSANVLKFKKLREAKYQSSRPLSQLLKVHQDAKCTDPRDKIYGLVGLSTDCFQRLPMDYRKTLWEVYKDVLTIYRLDPEILGLSKLLRSLIGGPDKISPRDLEEAKVTEKLELDSADPKTIIITTSFLGMIVYIGPTYNDIMSSFENVSDWEAAIEREAVCVRGWTAPTLELQREQSDLFLEDLEVISEEFLIERLSLSQKITWRRRNAAYESYFQVLSVERKAKLSISEHPRTASALFLIKDEYVHHTQTRMGVACVGAEPGDLVFRVPNYDLAMVVRDLGNQWILIGFAGMAKTAEQRKLIGRPQKNGKGLFDISNFSTSKVLDICLDMATLYRLSD
jgi:hypothetical protein